MERTFKAHAKLNLSLDVTGKREDGYHNITSVMQSIELSDDIVIITEPSPKNVISISCTNAQEYPNIKWDETNLVYKAAELMNSLCSEKKGEMHRIDIKVTKNIPDGAGMGGGSSDAATVLLALNEMLEVVFSEAQLKTLSVSIGADVPFCLTGGTALCEGIGEIITKLPDAPKLFCVLIKPEFSISTKEMYRLTDALTGIKHPDTGKLVSAIKESSVRGIFSACGNYMQAAATELHPEIDDCVKLLTSAGANVSLMTGSGSTVYGLFPDEKTAKKAFESISAPKAKKFISSFC